ncbi:unnamed protein product [Dicrocoelium dendriticum]|nr:unnamed protein product [Dicrocoelium dendriticum]
MRTCFGLVLLTLFSARGSLIPFTSRSECLTGCNTMWDELMQICPNQLDRAECIELNERGKSICFYSCEEMFPTKPHQ